LTKIYLLLWLEQKQRSMLSLRLVGPVGRLCVIPLRIAPKHIPVLAMAPTSCRQASTGVVKVPGGTLADVKAQVETWDKAHKAFFGPERDLKNFPPYQIVERNPPARLGLIPDSWFQFFYPKTGVTGPYLFLGGFMTFLLGKEIWVMDHYFPEVLSFALMVYIIQRKFGKTIDDALGDAGDRMVQGTYLDPLQETKRVAQGKIDTMQRYMDQQAEYRRHMYAALKESTLLHLEASYRERLVRAHQEVRRRLDYQSQREGVRRRGEQEHMVQWIVSQVSKAITPQFERDTLSQCIANLKQLARSRAAAAS